MARRHQVVQTGSRPNQQRCYNLGVKLVWLIDMRTKKIRIILNGKEGVISVADFLGIVKNTVSVLGSLDEESQWTIGEISHSSPLTFEVCCKPNVASDPTGTFLNGISLLETESRRPTGFSDAALKYTKRLTAPLGNGITSITYADDDREPVSISQRIAASVDAVTHTSSYFSYTEIEGELGQITVHGVKSEFCIYDPITDKPTTCRFNPEDAEKVGRLITRRVRVYGKAKYSRTHVPQSVEVERWVGPIGEDSPTLEDLHRAEFRITTGEASEEVIRKLRGLDE